MVPSEDLKRELLHQAVAENVGHREGRRLPPPAAARSARRHTFPAFGLAALVALAAAGSAWWLAGREQTTAPAAAPTAQTESLPAFDTPRPARTTGSPETTTFAAPVPIDAEVFSLALRHIVLDPGHGGTDAGAKAPSFEEKELTLDIALRLRDFLHADGFEVAMTREDDRYLNLRERAELANQRQADLFLSIHLNWIVEHSVRGVETYFLGETQDPVLDALARQENRDSGYSRQEVDRLLEGIYAGVRSDQSSALAERIQLALFRSLRQVNPQLVNRGVKTAPFVVLGATRMPAILAEVSCLSNREEVELLADPQYRDRIAQALRSGVQSYSRHVNQTEDQGS